MGTLDALYTRMIRRRRARRHLANRGCALRGDLRDGHLDLHVGMEENLDDAAAVHRLRFGVLHIVDGGGEVALELRGDALFHLLRAESGVIPQHGDDGNVDVRENVGGGSQNHQRADQQNQQRKHNERVRPVERDSDDPHLGRYRSILIVGSRSGARPLPFGSDLAAVSSG